MFAFLCQRFIFQSKFPRGFFSGASLEYLVVCTQNSHQSSFPYNQTNPPPSLLEATVLVSSLDQVCTLSHCPALIPGTPFTIPLAIPSAPPLHWITYFLYLLSYYIRQCLLLQQMYLKSYRFKVIEFILSKSQTQVFSESSIKEDTDSLFCNSVIL